MVHHYFLEDHTNGGACIVIGKVLMMHVADEILMENYRINLDKYKPVALVWQDQIIVKLEKYSLLNAKYN